MKTITLYKNKGTVIIDDSDYDVLSQYRWHLDHGYASMTVKKPKPGVVYMHRLVNRTPVGMSTDHINGDKLDNRKSNLRSCTQSENNANAKIRKDNKSGFKGVFWDKKEGRWSASIMKNNKGKFLGYFDDKLDAALAYKKAAIETFGEFTNVDL